MHLLLTVSYLLFNAFMSF